MLRGALGSVGEVRGEREVHERELRQPAQRHLVPRMEGGPGRGPVNLDQT